MPAIPLRDLDDPRVALFRSVRDADLLCEHGLFVAEGRLVVERVLLDGRHVIDQLLLSPAAYRSLHSVIDAHAPDAPVWLLESAAAFEAITGVNIHRGCLALAHRPTPLAWRAALGDSPLTVVLEAVADADNVGSVFRSAAAFGVGAVLLSPTCCDPLYRKAIRTSMGSTTRVPFARLESWPELLSQLKAEGLTLVGLSPREPSLTLEEFAGAAGPRRLALLVGTEGTGLSAAAEDSVDARVRIPISPKVDSLNLAVAVGIALSRLARIPAAWR